MPTRILALVIDYATTTDAERLTRRIAGLVDGSYDVHVVHVDNGNATPALLSLAQRELGVHLVRIAHNGGYASGIRKAISSCTAAGEWYDAYWMLNSDLDIDSDCLPRLVRILDTEPSVGALGPTVFHGRSGRVWGARGVVSPMFGSTAMKPWPSGGVLPRWSYLPGCALFVRASAYHDVGGIPDRYGMYYEETHICVQLQKRGWDLYVEPEAHVYHDAGDENGAFPTPHRAFYFVRNNLYFWRQNFGIPWFVQLPRTLAVIVRHFLPPLLKAPSLGAAFDRLRYICMGLSDSFSFLNHRFTHFERKHFDIAPK